LRYKFRKEIEAAKNASDLLKLIISSKIVSSVPYLATVVYCLLHCLLPWPVAERSSKLKIKTHLRLSISQTLSGG